jgi:hypothetical protein
MVLIDPYGLTVMEDAGEAGVEAGRGFGRGFVHPLQTLYDNSGRIAGFGHDIYNSDFSRISHSSRHDMAKFASARTGEAIGMAVAVYSIAKMLPGLVVGDTRIFGTVFNRFCAKNTCAKVAESRVAIAAEAKVATMGETTVASENATGMATRIGAPSKPIWSKTKDLSSAQNALKHWRDHGKQFEGI